MGFVALCPMREREGGLLLPLLEEVVTEFCFGYMIQTFTKSLNLGVVLWKSIAYVRTASFED